MAKKAELLEQAKKLKLSVTAKNTISEIEAAITETSTSAPKEEAPEDAPQTLAKAGKRSAKAVAEVEAKQEKQERKKAGEVKEDTKEKPKIKQNPPKSRLERRGKNYKKVAESVDKSKRYKVDEAIDLVVKTNPTKFDATVEVHARLGVDPKQADQNVRDTVILPSGSGKSLKVLAYTDEDNIKKAKDSGADVAIGDELLNLLDKEQLDFDILITTPDKMPKLAKYARLLGPKGLMPNPKAGTVTNNIEKAVSEAKKGKVEYRIDSSGIIHLGIGKVSFGKDKLVDNANAIFSSLKSNKPASLKGNYIESVFVTTTMGPSIELDRSSL